MNELQKWRRQANWDPFREMFRDMEEIQNRMAALFGRQLPISNREEEAMAISEWSPAVDISEDDKEYTIKAELPGVNKEDVRVSVEGNVLTIAGERKTEREEKNKKYHRIERSFGSFARSFTLPEGGSTEKVTADFKDGVLIVHLAKDEKAKPKAIEVKVS